MNGKGFGLTSIILIVLGVIVVLGIGVGARYLMERGNAAPQAAMNIVPLPAPTAPSAPAPQQLTPSPSPAPSTPVSSNTSAQPNDCGSSDSCFSEYMKTCTPATATISNQGLTYVETITGYTGDACVVTLMYTTSPTSNLVGKGMTCNVPKSNLANFTEYLQGDNMKQSCTGSLVDLMVQAGAK